MLKTRRVLTVAGLLLWGCLLGTECISAADSSESDAFTIDRLGTKDGLPGSSVIALTQTRDGYLWLGTQYGLVRFDGIQFTVFDESNTPGLGSGAIVHLFEDSRGGLWVGTETAGVVLIKDGKVTPIEFGRGGRERCLVATCEDASGAVWLYAFDGMLGCYRNGALDDQWPVEARASLCRALAVESPDSMWVGTDFDLLNQNPALRTAANDLLFRSTPKPARVSFLLTSKTGGYWRLFNGRVQKCLGRQVERDFGAFPWGGARVMTACEDRQGNLIVGAEYHGVYWFDPEGKATRITDAQGLSHNTPLSLCVDREGSLWVGTDGGGINRVRRKPFRTAPVGLGWVVRSVCEDAQGGLWVGFVGGGGPVGATYVKDGKLQDFGTTNGLVFVWHQIPQPLGARCVLVTRDQRVLAGTLAGLFSLNQNRFERVPEPPTLGQSITALHEDQGGRLWVGTQNGLARRDQTAWKVFSSREGLSSPAITAIASETNGCVWIGTADGGLNRMCDDVFTVYRATNSPLPSDSISSLRLDADHTLWIGTSSGLARLRAGKWKHYSTSEGLASNRIGYLLDDERGGLWLGSNLGVMRVTKRSLEDFAEGRTNSIECRNFGEADGLPSGECSVGSQPGPCRTKDGRLWFPTTKGLASVDPARLRLNTNPPPVKIEAVFIEGQSQNTNRLLVAWPKTLVVPPRKQRIDIHYTSLNLAAADRARFRYRLRGHDPDWIDAGESREAHYSKLPPDEYHFEVTACNEDGVWNPTPATLGFVLKPPFWRTWWFLGATAVALLGGVVLMVHFISTQKLKRQLAQLKQKEALEKERARIARDLHDQLGASMTQLGLLGEMAEADKDLPEEVEAHARQITQTARDTTHVLDEIVWAVNPSNDTLEGLVNYICKNAQDYLEVAGLSYRVEIPPRVPHKAILPEVRHNVFLAAKEAVTNVVRHAQATSARIRLRVEENSFTVEIEDNGRGLEGLDPQAAAARNGLRNMRKRMEDVGGSFFIGPAPEKGAVVRLTAPLKN